MSSMKFYRGKWTLKRGIHFFFKFSVCRECWSGREGGKSCVWTCGTKTLSVCSQPLTPSHSCMFTYPLFADLVMELVDLETSRLCSPRQQVPAFLQSWPIAWCLTCWDVQVWRRDTQIPSPLILGPCVGDWVLISSVPLMVAYASIDKPPPILPGWWMHMYMHSMLQVIATCVCIHLSLNIPITRTPAHEQVSMS